MNRPAVAGATWDGAKLMLTESFKVLGTVQYGGADEGSSDPLVSNASCATIQHVNPTGYAPFSNPAKKQSRPLLRGKTTLAEAEALSKKSAAASHPAPAPAPAPNPIKSLSKPTRAIRSLGKPKKP
jgi:hypothetical protein